ncbi:hypothetical protein BDZ94DRAFT_1273026 [Collybia nuda]|uniref:Secreted protein n=1 Tax=Collybia nuda TaxID=64659 RepID=A0A9P5XTP9_9AGAR|nr:hypothetical protein BDZ94DRAFT_1273026 [Collybia nuda]
MAIHQASAKCILAVSLISWRPVGPGVAWPHDVRYPEYFKERPQKQIDQSHMSPGDLPSNKYNRCRQTILNGNPKKQHYSQNKNPFKQSKRCLR